MSIKNFLEKNTEEMILGVAVAVLITLLGNFTLEQGLVLMVLAPVAALLLSNLMRVVVPNERNQRTALIILAVLGGFFLIQYFHLGIFHQPDLDVPSSQSITAIAGAIGGAGLGGFGGILVAIGIAVVVLLLMGGPFAWAAVAIIGLLFIFLGIPFLQISMALAENFQLFLIIFGIIALGFLLFKTKQYKAIARR